MSAIIHESPPIAIVSFFLSPAKSAPQTGPAGYFLPQGQGHPGRAGTSVKPVVRLNREGCPHLLPPRPADS